MPLVFDLNLNFEAEPIRAVDLKNRFDAIDVNCDGVISRDEVRAPSMNRSVGVSSFMRKSLPANLTQIPKHALL